MAINYVAFHWLYIHGFFMGHSWHINGLFCSSDMLRWSKYIYSAYKTDFCKVFYKTILSNQVFLSYCYLFDCGYGLFGSGSAVESR